MEQHINPEKRILKPAVIHDDLPGIEKSSHSESHNPDNDLPENPERNYHHEEPGSVKRDQDKIKHADDDLWNGEDA